jgi:hypothetical protein
MHAHIYLEHEEIPRLDLDVHRFQLGAVLRKGDTLECFIAVFDVVLGVAAGKDPKRVKW